MKQEASASRQYEVAALKRGLLFLDCFVNAPAQSWRISEVARAVGLNRGTAFRFIATLESAGYLEATGEAGSYRLAQRLHPLPREASWPVTVQMVCFPVLQELAEQCGETVEIAVLYRDEAMIVQGVEGAQSVRVQQKVGATRPAHLTAAGKVLLSNMDEPKLGGWLRGRNLEGRTAKSITDPRQLKVELARIRSQGFSVDDQEFEVGLACVAVPVCHPPRAVTSALVVSGPSIRLTNERILELLPTIRQSAQRLCQLLSTPVARD